MAEIDYLDFDLLIEPAEEGYAARVLSSPAGQACVGFSLPFSALELENFLLRVGRTRRGVRRLESPEMEAAKAFGGHLFKTVFGGDVRGCLRSSLDEAGRQGAGLRVRLRLAEVPELADVPWEYLYNPTLNRFLVLSVDTPLVRYLDLPERIRPLAVRPPLRVLVMISCPSDHTQLDVEREWAKLQVALGSLKQRGLLALDRLEQATLVALQRRLRRGEYHVFHFIGHGGFDRRVQDGMLLLEHEGGRGRPVSGQDLGVLLHDERTLRLVILNACEGARTSRTDPFAGTAQSLVQQGIPAVIAMQFEITDEAAITLAHEFYSALADGYPVDAALAEARKAIFAQDNDVEWGTPVLYMRAPDGRVFDIERVSDEERQRAQVDAVYREAQAAMAGEEWERAIERLQALLALDPTHAEAAARLRQAQQRQELAVLYTRGRKHYDAGRWPQALNYFRQVQQVGGDYKGVAALIASAEKAMAQEQGAQMPGPIFSKPGWSPWVGISVVLVVLMIAGVVGFLIIPRFISPSPSTPAQPTTFVASPEIDATATVQVVATERVQETATAVVEASATSEAQQTATAVAQFEATRQAQQTDPAQTVADYYSAINNREYQRTWSLLSNHFKDIFNSKPDGSHDFDGYVQWWDSVAQVYVGQVSVVEQVGSTAVVIADLRYYLKDGRVINDGKPRIQLEWDATHRTWLFYDKGP
jgi:tetratricopeptide (TPR) repeat protein